jgi:chaperonin cofactor prefoldin
MEDRQKKLSQIFEHLDEYEQRKKKRKQEIEDFKKELERLQNDKPLYMIRQEEYI